MISELLDSSVMPGMQGGPLMHIILQRPLLLERLLKMNLKFMQRELLKMQK